VFSSGSEGKLQREATAADTGEATVARWDAQTEYAIGVLILRYLRQHPPPRPTDLSRDLGAGARDLESAGLKHLRQLGERRLFVV
jgi:hypothetical protein